MDAETAIVLFDEEYSRMAEVYDRNVVPRFAPMAGRVLDVAAIAPGERVLDLGCGTGNLALRAAERVGDSGSVTAIDLSFDAIQTAIRRAEEKGVAGVRFETMDARQILYPGGRFDAVLSCFGIPVFDPDRTFREAHRLLVEGGRMAFCEWSATEDPASRAFLELLQHHGTDEPPPRLRELREAVAFMRSSRDRQDLVSRQALTGMLHAAGFRDVQATTETAATRFADVQAYTDLRTSFGYVNRELEAMGPGGRADFETALAERLAPLRDEGDLVVPWEINYYLGTR